jgi:hypothetical protein
MRVNDILQEGYEILPPIDKDRYQQRDGLEGPFMTRSGKVVYYDPREGSYYDPDTDMYISYDDWKAMDRKQDAKESADWEDYLAKRKTLQDLQADPNTAKDPELQNAIIQRKEKLRREFPQYAAEDGKLSSGKKDPCWPGYEMVGMKKKNGKEVPNCVPRG